MPPLSYDIVDVFTDRAFAGNALAVVHGAEDLTSEQMQSIAAEFNLSETTFPTPGGDFGYRVRIFTAAEEVRFAGHPTIGTAWLLAQRGAVHVGTFTQTCGIGDVPVVVDADGAELTVAPRILSDARDPAALASALGVGAAAASSLRMASCGLAFGYLRVRPGAVSQAHLPAGELHLMGVAADDQLGGVCVYSVEPGGVQGLSVHSRVFCPGVGVTEDPATGSAAAALGLVLVAEGIAAAAGETHYTISQGAEIRRPSLLRCRVLATDGAASAVSVRGDVAAVASGTILTPP